MTMPAEAPGALTRAQILEIFKSEAGAVLEIDPEFIDEAASLPELGADSLRLIALALRLRPLIGFALPPGLLPIEDPISSLVDLFAMALSEPDPLAALTRAQRRRLGKAIEADLYLDPPPPATGAVGADEAAAPRRVFLTGASGFLGAYLVRELVTRTEAQIHCLVRAKDAEAGLARVKDNMLKFGLWSDGIGPRLEIEVGELGPERFGLTADRYDWLAREMSLIYHNGAAVHLTQPYAQMRGANVAGTRTILDLAQRGRVKPVAVVSTVGLLDTPELQSFAQITEDIAASDVTLLPNGYTQTKWVGEQLVDLAAARGVPAASLRVGHVIGEGVSEDLAGRLAHACFIAGKVPELTRPIDYVPPEYIAAAIVALPRRSIGLSGVYQLVNPQPFTPDDVRVLLAESDQPLEVVPVKTWLSALRGAALNDPAHPMFAAADLLGDPDHPEDQSFVELVLARPRMTCGRLITALETDMPPCPTAREILRSVLERTPAIVALASH